jgi:hypothetical protein
LLAWNLSFPTHVEEVLWKTAALVSIGIPLLFLGYTTLKWVWLQLVVFKRPVDLRFSDHQSAKSFLVMIFRWNQIGLPTRELDDSFDLLKQSGVLQDPEKDMPISWYEVLDLLSEIKRVTTEYTTRNGLWRARVAFKHKRNRDYTDPELYLPRQRRLFELLDDDALKRHLKTGDSDRTELLDLPQMLVGNLGSSFDLPGTADIWREILAVRNFLRENDLTPRIEKALGRTALITSGLIYVLSRLSIIAVAFSSLRAMPESVYYTTWSKYTPNVG